MSEFFALPPDDQVIDLSSDDYFMGEALRQAAKAYAGEEVPIGAVMVRGGKIVARAHNQVEMLKDATAHAEILAISQTQQVVDDWRLTECTLYVTKEPCPMCAGAIMLSRIKRVVFGVGDPKAGGAGGALNILELPGLHHKCSSTGGVRENECQMMLKSFFKEQRQRRDNGDESTPPARGLN
ncbi:MAG: tRNA adenosine(34) deaminase TadA [Verrucomicrobiota bacterium]|nr:tRNA adenosine(34) deaminase TadA [Verrucomicrobiota bacterium]